MKKRNIGILICIVFCLVFTIFGIFIFITSLGTENSSREALAMLVFCGIGVSGIFMAWITPKPNKALRMRLFVPGIIFSITMLISSTLKIWATGLLHDVLEPVITVVGVGSAIGFYFYIKLKSKV